MDARGLQTRQETEASERILLTTILGIGTQHGCQSSKKTVFRRNSDCSLLPFSDIRLPSPTKSQTQAFHGFGAWSGSMGSKGNGLFGSSYGEVMEPSPGTRSLEHTAGV